MLHRANLNWFRKSVRNQLILGVVAAIGGLLFLWTVRFIMMNLIGGPPFPAGSAPESVTSLVIQPEQWRDSLSASGNIISPQGAVLAAEEAGKVVSIAVEAGGEVSQGDFLLEIDASVEDARLIGVAATVARARSAHERAKRLMKDQAMSQDAAEAAQEALARALSEESALKAIIARKRIHAPFAGVVGIRQVNIGQYVRVGDPLIPLFSLDPLYVDFSVAQSRASHVAVGQMVELSIDSFPERAFTGSVTVVNPQVDDHTRTVMVRAQVENRERLLRPGMFATVRLLLGDPRTVITAPQSAIVHAPYGDSVWVITPGEGTAPRTISARVVRLGARRGDRVVIDAGLQRGDEIVTSGGFKLRPDLTVIVNNSHSPRNDLAPKPADT